MNRSHVIHARVPGALLLELYSRDGLGTMVSADFYEGDGSYRNITGSGSGSDFRVSVKGMVRVTAKGSIEILDVDVAPRCCQ